MKTRLIFIAVILILLVPLAASQNAEKTKTSLAILGGINFQNLNGKDISGDKLQNDLLTGFHAGLNIQIPIAPAFCFQPGLLFSTKGAKNTSNLISTSTRLSYIELPMNLVYKGKLGNGFVMIGFGPYVAYGISGKVTYGGGDATLDSKVRFQNVVELTDPQLTTYFKGLDAGGNIFAGYETSMGLFFQLNTQFGMLKINPENKWVSDDKSSVKNTGFGISAGYRF
jgi:hypothetical protein